MKQNCEKESKFLLISLILYKRYLVFLYQYLICIYVQSFYIKFIVIVYMLEYLYYIFEIYCIKRKLKMHLKEVR